MQDDNTTVIFNGMRILFGEVPWSTRVCNGPSWGTLYPVDEPTSDKIGYATSGDFIRWLHARRTMQFPEIVVNGRACIVA